MYKFTYSEDKVQHHPTDYTSFYSQQLTETHYEHDLTKRA